MGLCGISVGTHSVSCIYWFTLLIMRENWMCSWVVNRMDILEEQRNIWPPGRPHQHFSEAQLPGGFLDLTPLPLQISLSIHYLHWQRAWCKSPETTHSSQQLDFSETVKWHFFPNYSSQTLDGGKKPFCEMVRLMTIHLLLWWNAVLARHWNVAYDYSVSSRNGFLGLLF